MEGLSPWELATLKVVYHRSDQGRKGFLNADDVSQLCKDLGVNISNEESQNLFREMDVNNDGRISFSELMTHLCTNNQGRLEDMQLRAAMLDNTALVATGAAIPLILKGKTMVVLGTLFYDPVRLFRDFYVDYFHGLKKFKKEKITKEDVQGLVDGVKKGFKAGAKLKTTALVVLAVSVDCAVGAFVFLVYAKVRSRLQRMAQEKFLKMQRQEEDELLKSKNNNNNKNSQVVTTTSFYEHHPIDNHPPPSVMSVVAEGDHLVPVSQISTTQTTNSDGEKTSNTSTTTTRKRLNKAEVCMLEATSGAIAGIAAGVLTPLAKRVVDRDLYWPDSGVGGRTILRIRHGMAAHAAFFTGFYYFRSSFADIAYKKMQFQSNNFYDAIVTTLAGCCAGGCWKLASDPLKNRDEWVAKHGIEQWRNMQFYAKMGIRTKGLGWALAQTMPVTGVAFLFYEASFSYFL